jgi:hypothetical protein
MDFGLGLLNSVGIVKTLGSLGDLHLALQVTMSLWEPGTL